MSDVFQQWRESLPACVRQPVAEAAVRQEDFAERQSVWRSSRRAFLAHQIDVLGQRLAATQIAAEVYEREQLRLGLELLAHGHDQRL